MKLHVNFYVFVLSCLILAMNIRSDSSIYGLESLSPLSTRYHDSLSRNPWFHHCLQYTDEPRKLCVTSHDTASQLRRVVAFGRDNWI